ncbi:hypothetical protein SAMN05421731_1059 [Acinetobacter puyangensis]|uniref:Uncharacterized protein n=1 Tax=Acinetobacter puyangensis TaxID=1096779 RepID=A0A240E9Q5_9GAMM|nr:hypothetical protein SAMN05421731_1059 [Acinetobacter puyangensis]
MRKYSLLLALIIFSILIVFDFYGKINLLFKYGSFLKQYILVKICVKEVL